MPAFNEERFIARVIETMPEYVDKIYVVNDGSTDRTANIILEKAKQDKRISIINRETKSGVGGAIITGHKIALKEGLDIVGIMAGDGQMDPSIFQTLLDPIALGEADYAKGNRLSRSEHRKEMPLFRLFGNFLLTTLTRIASGYWNISDPQDGYTAISTKMLKMINLDEIEKGFAFENDMLVKLNAVRTRVIDIPHQAIYRGQKSKIHYSKFIIRTSWLLLKDSVWRVWVKHLKRSNPILSTYNDESGSCVMIKNILLNWGAFGSRLCNELQATNVDTILKPMP